MSSPTSALASFASGLDHARIPADVAADAKRLLLDAIGSSLIGWTSEETARIRAVVEATAGPGASTVIGSSPLSPWGAAMVNAYLITARSFCDVHRPTLCHVTPVIVPPVLAAAERAAADGPTVIAALAAGMEILIRLGTALDYPEFRSRGWHTPGVAGPIAGAAGVARAMSLDPGATAHAMGLGGTQASGTFASLGSPAIKFHQARAAAASLVSADLAATGFTASTDILTHHDGGILSTYSDGGDPEALTAGLGTDWHLGDVSTRRWPAAAALQGMIAALLDPSVPPIEISKMTVGLAPDAYEMNAEMGWATPFEATLSTRWVAAVVAEDRECWLPQFLPERLADPATTARAEAIEVVADGRLAEGGVDLTLELVDGSLHRDRREPDESGDWEATAEKLLQAANGVIARSAAFEVIEIVGSLEGLDGVDRLLALLGA